MICCAIIPVKGREPLLYFTVRRLVNDGITVICVGHTVSEKLVCEMAGAEFIQVRGNMTLGAKWQMALSRARGYDAEYVLYMGSSDWVSHNWCEVMMKDVDNGYAMTGTKGIYFLDIQPQNVKSMIFWGGYTPVRAREPIGTGRLFGRKALNLIGWKLFDVTKNSSMDHSQIVALSKISDKWGDRLINYNSSPAIASLSISTYRWGNKHNFRKESKYETAKKLSAEGANDVISRHFIEAENLFNE